MYWRVSQASATPQANLAVLTCDTSEFRAVMSQCAPPAPIEVELVRKSRRAWRRVGLQQQRARVAQLRIQVQTNGADPVDSLQHRRDTSDTTCAWGICTRLSCRASECSQLSKHSRQISSADFPRRMDDTAAALGPCNNQSLVLRQTARPCGVGFHRAHSQSDFVRVSIFPAKTGSLLPDNILAATATST